MEYRKLLDLDPKNALALNNLAFILADTGTDPPMALAYAHRARQLVPNEPTNPLQAEEILGKLPADAFGGPRARATFHWVCGDIDSTADWIEKAIEQSDPDATLMLRLWSGRELRSTPHWARLMRKLNLPEE